MELSIPGKSSHSELVLNLRAGDLVQVRSKEEILATLDEKGRLDGLPFMPEMLQYCGQTLRVYKRADKACDTIHKTGARRMDRAVHLENVRCDGCAHGGCQAACLIYWKEAWLRRSTPDSPRAVQKDVTSANASVCSEETIHRAVRRDCVDAGADADAFSCQVTELYEATSDLAWWDIRQYIRDVRSRNITLRELAYGTSVSLFNAAVRTLRRTIFAVGHALNRRHATHGEPADATSTPAATTGGSVTQQGLITRVRDVLHNVLVEYPHVRGQLRRTPSQQLDLKPGEYVQVKTRNEILATLDVNNRNRGLLFDVEMVPYCGGTYRVLRRVERILDERTGKMLRLPNSCIVLDGVFCQGCLSRTRLFCPRSIYPYWHEIWLRRPGEVGAETRSGI